MTAKPPNTGLGDTRKAIVFFIGKLALSFVLVAYAIKNWSFDLTQVVSTLFSPVVLVSFFLLTAAQLLLASYRTTLLIRSSSDNQVSLQKVTLISWAANFISGVMPSNLIADIYRFKMLSVVFPSGNLDPYFHSTFLSKIFSLYALIVIPILSHPFSNNPIQELKLFSTLVLIGTFLFVIWIYFQKSKKTPSLKDLNTKTFIGRRIQRAKEYFLQLISSPSVLVKCLGISLLSQCLNTISFLFIIQAMNPGSDLFSLDLLVLIPIGILMMSLPISFSGLGVGNVAFAKLLLLEGYGNGSDVFNVFFLLSFIFNVSGVIPFLMLREKRESAE